MWYGKFQKKHRTPWDYFNTESICRTPKYHPVVPMKAMAQMAPVQTAMPIILEVNVHGTLWPHEVANWAEDDQEGFGQFTIIPMFPNDLS